MPHELPARGTAERAFMEAAFNEIQEDRPDTQPSQHTNF
jgi:hypothetical protein